MKKKSKKHGNQSCRKNMRKSSDAAGTAVISEHGKVATDREGDSSGVPYFTVDIVDRCRQGPCGTPGSGINAPANLSSEAQLRLYRVQGVAVDLLLKSYNTMIELAAVRLECKLSNTRVSGVARELKELIKVMSVYDC